MIIKNIVALGILMFVTLAFSACGEHNSNSGPTATDYSIAAHWLSLPVPVKDVDVFYFYPTVWQIADQTNPHVCEIDNPSMLAAAPAAFDRQATAFELVGNIYAPYYRQDNLSPVDREEVIAGIPTMDGIAAFDYYIKHFNNGRPFILAGHSQGSNVLSNLLAEYMADNPDVYSRMIVAYVIGYSITPEYLADNPHLKFATGPDDTGVIVSYNTEYTTVDGINPVLSTDGIGIAINPLTWTTDETPADASENLGSIQLNQRRLRGARCQRGPGVHPAAVCECSSRHSQRRGDLQQSRCERLLPGAAAEFGVPRGVYHTFDYPFYYFNIRENAAVRVANFTNP